MKTIKRKEFYTTQELANASWFPASSIPTIIKFIEQGKLDAWNVSTTKTGKRYRISKESVEEFLKNKV